jgi:hypothetical protein
VGEVEGAVNTCRMCAEPLPLEAFDTDYKGRPFSACRECYRKYRRTLPHYFTPAILAKERTGILLTDAEKAQVRREQAERCERRERDRIATTQALEALQRNRLAVAPRPLPASGRAKESRRTISVPGRLYRAIKLRCEANEEPVAAWATHVLSSALADEVTA